MSVPTPVRPTQYAGWASGPSGSIRIVEPSSTEKAIGWQAGVSGASGFMGGVPPSTYFNWAMNLYYQWQKYFDEKQGLAYVGDGSDGDITLVNQTFVATRPMQIANLALGLSGVFKPNGQPWMAHLLTGVSGVIEGIAGDGGAGRAGFSVEPRYYGVPASGPLKGAYGGDYYNLNPTGGYNYNPTLYSMSVPQGLGGQGGTGGTVNVAGADPGRGGTSPRPPGPWARLPEWLDARWRENRFEGVTGGYVAGGAGGGYGSIGSVSPGAGGAGGEHIRGMIGEVNFRGTVRSRGGRGGTGYYTAGIAAGPGGGGGGGSAGFGIGRKTRWEVTYDFSGGLPGMPYPANATGGVTGFAGGAGTGIEMLLP